jgi:hypothetical protein
VVPENKRSKGLDLKSQPMAQAERSLALIVDRSSSVLEPMTAAFSRDRGE